jgi:hypothetical protein
VSEQAPKKYPVELILRLACAAQRVNNGYLKEHEGIYTDDNKLVGVKYSNRDLIKVMLEPNQAIAQSEFKPQLLKVTKADVELAETIRKYFKRLIFAAVEGENEFQMTVNHLLSVEETEMNKLGFIACLPSVYEKDYNKTRATKALRDCEESVLGSVDDELRDLDSEIVEVKKSKNFDAHNVLAIVDNKIVSWMTKNPPTVGPAVILKAKVKGYNTNWLTKLPETRLNYVKVFQ